VFAEPEAPSTGVPSAGQSNGDRFTGGRHKTADFDWHQVSAFTPFLAGILRLDFGRAVDCLITALLLS